MGIHSIYNNIARRTGFTILLFFIVSLYLLNAQAEKKFIRKGNRDYEKHNYSESEILYRKALDRNKEAADAIFNIGDALYKQEKYEDAGNQFIEHINRNEDSRKKSDGMYNLGNSLLKSNKVKESIEAFKGSLKLNPDNMEAKYNLAFAQDLLKEQQQQQQQQQQQDKNNNQDQDQNKNQQGNNNQQQNSPQDKQEQEEGQQGTVSKEDAERLLNAIANDEKKVQEKVKLAKAASDKSRTLKNW